MISNLVSFFISTRLQPEPIYEALAVQDGIHLPSAATRHQRGGRQVVQLARPPEELFQATMTVGEAWNLAHKSEFNSWPVCDERGVIGVVSKLRLEQAVQEHGVSHQLRELVKQRVFPHLHGDQSLHFALERMGDTGLDRLPVVSRADVHRLEGIVLLRDVLDSYGIAGQDQS
jgi:CIC family chloride channel protein